MLYQMLTGHVPQGTFDDVSKQVPGLDPRWNDIIHTALRADPAQRYADALQLRRALDVITTQPVEMQTSPAMPATNHGWRLWPWG